MLSLAVCVFTKMHRYLIAALSLAALLGSAWAGNSSCHCSKPTLCNRVQYDQKEVHGIILKTNEKVWSHFNWTKLTTVTLIDFFDEKLLCVAHEHNVRILTQERFALEHVENSSYVNNWLAGRIQWVQHHFTDGIHLLVDDPLPKGHILASKLTQFAQLVTKTFHEKVPGSIVVFNVPYSPYNEQKNGVDGRNYDFFGLSRAVDQFFINDFNHRRQSFEERCLAGANSNFYYTMGGILAYESLNVSMDKLVLGVPYFAYDYECLEYAENLRCYIQPKSYRGSHCSSDVALMVPQNVLFRTYALRGEFWDEHTSTMIYNYVSQPYGVVHQVWYERNTTLILKYNQAAEHGLLGVGMWALNYLDHGSWAYIPHIKNKAIH